MANDDDRWSAGATYEDFMGRWSRQLAPRFVSWLQMPAGEHWLDAGCGTGALTDAICAHASPASVTGSDPATPLIDFARRQCRDPRVTFVVAGSGSLPPRQDGYGCVASLLALNFFPDVEAAVREMRSLAAGQGIVSACVWDYADGMEFLRCFWDAAAALDPAARTLDEGARFPVCREGALADVFRASGLSEVQCDALLIPTEFAGFDDFWNPLLGGTGPAPAYVASLDTHGRAELAQTLMRTLPRTSSGAIPLTARAWAVRGRVS